MATYIANSEFTQLASEEQIAKTEKMRDQLMASLTTKGTEAGDGVDPASPLGQGQSADPTQASMLLQIQSQLRSNQLEITNRERSVATRRRPNDEGNRK